LSQLIDTHCHLDFDAFDSDRDDILGRAARAGVSQIITIGIDLVTSRQAIDLSKAHDEVYATVGIHPHSACPLSSEDIVELSTLAHEPKVVAYGEIGLDFYRNYQPHSVQTDCFRLQLELARELNLPVVIHDREAHHDTLQVLQEQCAWEMGGTMHCFSGDLTFAHRCLDLGFYLTIAGPVTFNKSHTLQDVARNCPLDRLLLETDAPFLAPVPKRGKRNEPSYLVHTAAKVAALRGLPPEEVARQTTANARRLFRLPEPAG
jgi:TatD DNase family protein